MIKASIVSIGNELLNGQTIDTNAPYLSGKLLSISIPVVSAHTVGDDVALIVRALNQTGSEADVVLATGGLGPTDDDLTRQAVAEFLGVELRLESGLLRTIQGFFERRGLPMPDRNKAQAYIPAGAQALANDIGTAPGIMAETRGKLLVALPGVPSEMKQAFEQSVLEKLKELACGQAAAVRKLRCFGTGESNIAELLGPLMERRRNPLINCTARHGIITLQIIATATDSRTAQEMAERDETRLRKMLGNLVFGTDEQTLAEVVGRYLGQQKKTIAVAESCTGGTVARLLTDVPGASNYFTHGWVSYSNQAKIDQLSVPAELIKKHGAVSQQVAAAMAWGARKRAGTDVAIGVTGIAGPTGASEQKPVGLVYIAVDCEEGCETERFVISGDRATIRLRAAQSALNLLRLKLQI
ncbi:MAG: competence/damage-inducible protein A [Planctomycetota bacterium]|jgi:nicotinamide-nucleotide amidase